MLGNRGGDFLKHTKLISDYKIGISFLVFGEKKCWTRNVEKSTPPRC